MEHHLCRLRYHILRAIFDFLCGCTDQARILALARGLTTNNFIPQFLDLLIDVWLLAVADLLVMVDLDWSALHADSGLAHLALLSEIEALTRVKVAASQVSGLVCIPTQSKRGELLPELLLF